MPVTRNEGSNGHVARADTRDLSPELRATELPVTGYAPETRYT